MHQSSLGTLMLIAGSRCTRCGTPLLPLLFLISCIVMGFAAVVSNRPLERGFSGARDQDARQRSPPCVPLIAATSLAALGDLVARGQLALALQPTAARVRLLASSRCSPAPSCSCCAAPASARSRPPLPRRDGADARRRALPLRHLPGGVHPGAHWSLLPERPRDLITTGWSRRRSCSTSSSSSVPDPERPTAPRQTAEKAGA